MAIIHRTEQKRILINQIRLCRVLLVVIERLMRGLTLEFAVLRVHEFESQKDHYVNRLMVKSYVDSLERGLKANQEKYYSMYGLSPEQGNLIMKEV